MVGKNIQADCSITSKDGQTLYLHTSILGRYFKV